MNRRVVLGLLASAAGWPVAARAQTAGKVWRIGVLEVAAQALNTKNFDAMRSGLRDLGYVEGQNLVIEYQRVKVAASGSPISRASWFASAST